jgi:N-acetylglucosamine-6-phosphate deacetylase
MDRGVENLMRLAGVSLTDAVRMATVNAARAGKVPGRTAGLAPGERADFVQFRFDGARVEVTGTWVSGRRVICVNPCPSVLED